MTDKSARNNAVSLAAAFEAGYESVSEEFVDGLASGDDIKVNNDTPVFTAEQLEQIAKTNNYKKVSFTDGDWSFNVSINDAKAINLLHNENAIKEIVSKYEDNSFAFLTFPSGAQFKNNGTMAIDVSSYADDFGGNFFVYRYLNGALTAIEASYDAEEETLSFSTNTLGRFVITDRAISDAVVVPGNDSNNSNDNSNTGSDTVVPENPSTGARI